MSFTRILSVTILILGGIDYGTCQVFPVGFDIQSFLNQFCAPSSTNPGCNFTEYVNPESVAPTPRPEVDPVTLNSCYNDEKQCPQLPGVCVPSSIDCNVIDPSVTCRVPQDYELVTQMLSCGDGSPRGARCGIGAIVPVLSVLIAQCQGSKSTNQRPESSFDVLNGPGDNGGAGVYRCSPSGTWEPKFQSPFIKELTVSCRNAGCGSAPRPSAQMPIHRPWAFVRGIYRDGELQCTGTLVSQNALVTAAHCVTGSKVSNKVDPNIDSYLIELPGTKAANPSIKIRPESIQIHPRYSVSGDIHQNDLAVIFFNFVETSQLPTVCISDRPHFPTTGKVQVVFNLQGDQESQPFNYTGGQNSGPNWKPLKASWDNTCLTTKKRGPGRCLNTLNVQSQFCASHKGVSSMLGGSSGGPYLADLGDKKQVWVLMGVLSSTTKTKFTGEETDGDTCFQENSVYGQVSDNSRWIKDCVFDKICGARSIYPLD